MKVFQPKLLTTLKQTTPASLLGDIVAGIIVAIIALPLSIALAIASGVSPEQGLYTAIVAGLFISLLGGSRVNISGPTAAFATIVAGVVATHGISGLVTATLLAGAFLILMGIFRFGSLIKYIPVTITTGFTSGIALTIVIGQIKDFLGLTFAPGTHAVETTEKLKAIGASLSTLNLHALLVGAVGLAILIVWPLLSRAVKGRVSTVLSKIPASIIAVIVGILLLKVTPLQVNTIGSLYPDLPQGLPTPTLPHFSLETVRAVLPDALTIAVLAAIESLLSCVVSDGMIGDRHNSNTELIAQGVGNIASGLFGGIPATGAIARTAANVKNGGRSPIAGIVHALVLLLCLLLLMPLAQMIPMPIIAAILFMVAYNMSEWRHFVAICRTAPKSDVLVLVITFVLTVVFDLVVAIAVGLVLTALLFLKNMSDLSGIRRCVPHTDAQGNPVKIPSEIEVFEFCGPMFFADADKFASLVFDEDSRVVILQMGGVPLIDATAVGDMDAILKACRERGVQLLLTGLNEQPRKMLQRSGFLSRLGEQHVIDHIDPALQYAAQLACTSAPSENSANT